MFKLCPFTTVSLELFADSRVCIMEWSWLQAGLLFFPTGYLANFNKSRQSKIYISHLFDLRMVEQSLFYIFGKYVKPLKVGKSWLERLIIDQMKQTTITLLCLALHNCYVINCTTAWVDISFFYILCALEIGTGQQVLHAYQRTSHYFMWSYIEHTFGRYSCK